MALVSHVLGQQGICRARSASPGIRELVQPGWRRFFSPSSNFFAAPRTSARSGLANNRNLLCGLRAAFLVDESSGLPCPARMPLVLRWRNSWPAGEHFLCRAELSPTQQQNSFVVQHYIAEGLIFNQAKAQALSEYSPVRSISDRVQTGKVPAWKYAVSVPGIYLQ